VTARTFHARRGRLSEKRLATLRELMPRFGVPVGDDPVDLADLFGRQAAVVLEIGSGMGDATAEMAAANPEKDYLAVEVHTAGVADLLGRIEAHGLTNVRVAVGDAMHLVEAQLPPASLAAIHVFFPDPWPKSRHHKRRLIRPERVTLLREALKPRGTLHCATDAPDYAQAMLDALRTDPQLSTVYSGFAPRPGWRPVTLYERRALAAGRTVYDLEFRRDAG
jgi:tRNA (guanine-N7-)-methyltransferase